MIHSLTDFVAFVGFCSLSTEVNVFSELDVILNEIGYDMLKKIFNSCYTEEYLQDVCQVEFDVNSRKYYGAGMNLHKINLPIHS